MPGDRDRPPAEGLLENGPELVLETGSGDGRDIDQFALAIAESQRGGYRGLRK